MGFFITILVGFILGILFDRFIASEELDAIIQMIFPTEKINEYNNRLHFKYELFTDKKGGFYIKCPTCESRHYDDTAICVVCGTVL